MPLAKHARPGGMLNCTTILHKQKYNWNLCSAARASANYHVQRPEVRNSFWFLLRNQAFNNSESPGPCQCKCPSRCNLVSIVALHSILLFGSLLQRIPTPLFLGNLLLILSDKESALCNGTVGARSSGFLLSVCGKGWTRWKVQLLRFLS